MLDITGPMEPSAMVPQVSQYECPSKLSLRLALAEIDRHVMYGTPAGLKRSPRG